MERSGWYGVRCLFQWADDEVGLYEESVTAPRFFDTGDERQGRVPAE